MRDTIVLIQYGLATVAAFQAVRAYFLSVGAVIQGALTRDALLLALGMIIVKPAAVILSLGAADQLTRIGSAEVTIQCERAR